MTGGVQHDRRVSMTERGLVLPGPPWFSLFLLCHFRPSFVILSPPCHPGHKCQKVLVFVLNERGGADDRGGGHEGGALSWGSRVRRGPTENDSL